MFSYTIIVTTPIGGIFLETKFSYCIYDFLTIQKENLEYKSFIQRHFKIKRLLEKVSEECFSLEERENTKELIQRMYQDETGLMREIEIWLAQFYKS